MPRITSSRCPILAALKAEHEAALYTAVRDLTDENINAANKTRTALRSREDMFRPKRIRKAERKANMVNTIIRYTARQDQTKRCHVPATEYSVKAMGKASHYRNQLKTFWHLAPQLGSGYRDETIDAARNEIALSKHCRLLAAECGRRLP